MIKDIKTENTKKLIINGLTITVIFSEDRNISAGISVGKTLLGNMFRENCNNETSKDLVSKQYIKTMCKVS